MAPSKNDMSIIDEMAIVDIFTKLIFDASFKLDETETLLIEVLSQVDSALVGASIRDISEHLRAMGVDEMISVVGLVKRHYEQQHHIIATGNTGYQHPLHR